MRRSIAIVFLLIFLAVYFQPTSKKELSWQSRLIPVTGVPVPEMEVYDRVIADLMVKYRIPGGSLAVVKDGRLVFAHGYGYTDVDDKQPVQPDSLFRIASVSKPITAVTILKLIEEGELSLDDKAFRIMDIKPPEGKKVDTRIYDITIRHLLQHSGGWDREKSFDPMIVPYRISREMGIASPPDCKTIMSYMLGQPLDFDPGTKFAYSNFGYCVLGRIIEKVTGQTYEEYVRNHVLAPMGITKMRLGHTLSQAEGEVHYYDYPGALPTRSVFPDVLKPVSKPYGGFYLEAMDAHGGWIASSFDLVRFAVSIDGRRPPAFLKQEIVQLMTTRPEDLWNGKSYWYGMGFYVESMTEEASWWHTGSLPGTASILVRTYDGLAWAALFNSKPEDEDFFGELDQALWQASQEVVAWPDHDLFGATLSQTKTTLPPKSTEINGFVLILPFVSFIVRKLSKRGIQ